MTQLSVEQALELANQAQQQGNLQQAEAIYRQILAAAPNHPEALGQLGLLAFRVGRVEIAIDLVRRAALANPISADLQYNLAVMLASAGQSAAAAEAYRKTLQLQPDLAEAHVNLAALLIDGGDPDSAIEPCRRAIALRPEMPEGHLNLGVALRNKGRLDEAIAAHRQATVLRPQGPEMWNALGLTLQTAGRIDEAIDAYQRATALDPNHADTLENLAALLHQKGQTDPAIALMRRALAIRPNAPATLSNLAAILMDAGAVDEAVTHLRRAVTLQPDFADAHNNLGLALRYQGRLDESLQAYRQALGLRPNAPQMHRNLGQTLQMMGRTNEAIDAYRQAIALKPDYAEAVSSLGTALMELRRVEEGAECFRRAIELRPDYALSRFNLSQAQLLTGDWLEAWAGQEYRWLAPDLKLPRPRFRQPQWDGSDLGGKRILVFAEQGFGDAIQFGRYLPLVAQRGGRVIYQCHPGLIDLFRRMPGVEACIPFEADLPDFDVQVPLLTLPGIFRTTLDTIPATDAYLHADPELVAKWKPRVEQAAGGRLRIGLVWGGRADQKNDRNRSMPLAALAPLAEVPDVSFFSLQKGDPAKQLLNPPAGLQITDCSSDLNTFSDTAALLENLDLLISVDTAPAHLAGAMGRPVWVIAAFFADWRYMLNRSDNPWYNSMRVFRQPKAGDWQTPVTQVVEALRMVGSRQ